MPATVDGAGELINFFFFIKLCSTYFKTCKVKVIL